MLPVSIWGGPRTGSEDQYLYWTMHFKADTLLTIELRESSHLQGFSINKTLNLFS